MNKKFGLTGNQLKLIALAAMTIDHVGMMLFPYITWLRVIGRLAFPIFAYMIAEGCVYTRNRRKYLLTVVFWALVCQVVYFFVMGSLYQCVLVTFSLSIGLVYLVDHAVKERRLSAWVLALLGLTAVCAATEVLPVVLSGTDYGVDYGTWGVMLPLLVYFGATKEKKLLNWVLGLALISAAYGGIQWFSLAAVPLLMLYNGKRGKGKMKNLFYIYYPAHLVVIFFIDVLVG